MSSTVISRFSFMVMFPFHEENSTHVPHLRLHSLARKQMNDSEIIETIDHLFKCPRCLDNYRRVRARLSEVVSLRAPLIRVRRRNAVP